MEQDGNEVHFHASLNEGGTSTDTAEGKPLRSWNSDESEISIRLNIPNLPSDMWEIANTNGKYDSSDSSRAMTINGIDLRRSDLNEIIGGSANATRLDAGGKSLYVITGNSEAAYYNRMAYIVFEEEELVLKIWVSYGITDDELLALATTLTLEETDDATLAIPIINEVSDTTGDEETKVYYYERDPVYEADLLEIGQSARSATDYYTATVTGVEVYDNISVLNPNCILRKDFVERFTDGNGNLVPYSRTEIIHTFDGNNKFVSMDFGDTVSSNKKLYVVTMTATDVTMDGIAEDHRDEMLKACVNGYNLVNYSIANGEVELEYREGSFVIDRKPELRADSNEIIYREYLGNNQWKIAFLLEESDTNDSLLLYSYTSKIYVKIQ